MYNSIGEKEHENFLNNWNSISLYGAPGISYASEECEEKINDAEDGEHAHTNNEHRMDEVLLQTPNIFY